MKISCTITLKLYAVYVINRAYTKSETIVRKQVNTDALHVRLRPVVFHNGKVYDFNLLFDEIFNQNNNERKIKALPCGNLKARTFQIGII